MICCCFPVCRRRRSPRRRRCAHWLATGLPLLLAAGPVAIMLRMPETPYRSCCSACCLAARCCRCSDHGAAIVLGARRGGVLLPLLVLPLVTPVLIFGVGAADAVAIGLSPRPHLLLLAAMLAAALPRRPLAAGAGLRAAAGVGRTDSRCASTWRFPAASTADQRRLAARGRDPRPASEPRVWTCLPQCGMTVRYIGWKAFVGTSVGEIIQGNRFAPQIGRSHDGLGLTME